MGAHLLYPNHLKICKAIFLFVVITFMMKANFRALDWENDFQLFQSGLRICPKNAKIYYNLGQVTAERGNHAESIEYNTIANELKPGSQATLNNLANAYRHTGDLDNALKYHKQAIDIKYVK